MNLALHGFLLQVLVSILFQHGFLLCSAGEPGYLDFDNLPETNFSCQGKVIGGYYADVEAGCQMFHVCTIGQKDEIMDIKFLCLNGTVFDQETRVCERVDEVDCSKSERFYNLNLELYGNNAVTLSLHENNDDEDNSSDSLEDHQQRTTSARPTTTTTASTTTSRPSKPSTASPNSAFQHPTGYPQHYQPQPPFPQVHTSQSKSLYDDKNGGYHHQYIFHNGERNNNQATSFQLFSNQGVSSTTVQVPQIHQIRYSSTPSPQIIHNEPSTVSPLYHTSSTIQTLLNGNGNGPAIINPIFHNHGIASTTEQFTVHSNNPRDTSEYRDNSDREQNIRPLEAVQSTNQGKVSKLTISPVPTSQEPSRIVRTKISQSSQSQQRLQSNFLPTPATIETTVRSFYPTPRTSPKPTSSNGQVTHIHVPPPVPIPQLKPHQITINLPPPDIQRIIQNPSPLLPSQSRVIVTAKASVSDESGRPLNTSQLVTLPLPTIPASYDDYKEGDESFDPFYRDVPKIRTTRSTVKADDEKEVVEMSRRKRSSDQKVRRKRLPDTMIGRFHYGLDKRADPKSDVGGDDKRVEKKHNAESNYDTDVRDFRSIKAELMKFRQILFGGEMPLDFVGNFDRPSETVDEEDRKKGKKMAKKEDGRTGSNSIVQTSNITNHRATFVKDLQVKASKHLSTVEGDDDDYEIDEEGPESEIDNAEKDGESDENSSEEFDPETDVDGEGKEESESAVEEEEAETAISSKEKDDESDVYSTLNSSPDDDDDDDIGLETTTVLNDPANVKTEAQDESQHSLERHGTAESEGILSNVGGREKEADAEESTESGIVIDLKLPNSKTDVSGSNNTVPTEKKLEQSEIFLPLSTENPKEEIHDAQTDDATDIEHLEQTTVAPEEDKVELPNKLRVAEKGIESVPDKIESDEHPTTTEATVKYSARKKNGRRLSRRRMSARTKSRKEHASQVRETTMLPEIAEKPETTILPIVQFETEIGELIDDRIFEELESRTTKELDTRAVGQQDAKYIKSLQEDGRKNGKHNRLDRNGVRESLKGMQGNFGKNQDNVGSLKVHADEETTIIPIDLSSMKESEHRNKDEIESEDRKKVDEKDHEDEEKSVEDEIVVDSKTKDEDELIDENSTESFKGVVFSEEKRKSFMDKYFVEHHESSEEEILTVKDEVVDQHSEEKPNTVSASAETDDKSDVKSKQVDGSEELPADLESSDEKFEAADEESISQEEYSFDKNDDTNSAERSVEYNDRSTGSLESTQENSAEEEYVDFDSPEDSTISVERSSSEETSGEVESVEKSADRFTDKSTEESESALADEKDSTEGVLKFTDELPKNYKKDDTVEKNDSNESIEDSIQDYVDDNYEPKTYMKEEIPTTFVSPSIEETKKFTLDEEMKNKQKTERLDHFFENQRMKSEDQVQSGEEDFSTESKVVKKDRPESSNEDESEEIESTTMTEDFTTEILMTTTPLPTTTSTTESSTTLSTKATKRTTTTIRPTPPKLFKPISARRNYNYIPPTTTPNPVIIKPRLPLLNPKPAKPLKSYNDLVPKPVIRRLSLTRKLIATSGTTTTTEGETAIQEFENSSDIPLTTTEANKSKEDVLEIKFESNNHQAAKEDTVHKSDQVPNSSNTRTLNSSDSDDVKQPDNRLPLDTFTPYPLVRLSTLATTTDNTKVSSETEEYKHVDPTEATTMKDFEPTSLDPDDFVILATLVPDVPQHTEITTDTPVEPEEYQTTMAVMIDGKEVTVVSTEIPVESSTTHPGSTTVSSSTLDSQTVQPDSLTSTTSRPRKVISSKRHSSFNCLEKEMYRFYGDTRDCRLFHYCSPGFTSRQVLDFRFVCEEGTTFDEESQSCRHDVQNRMCHKRPW